MRVVDLTIMGDPTQVCVVIAVPSIEIARERCIKALCEGGVGNDHILGPKHQVFMRFGEYEYTVGELVVHIEASERIEQVQLYKIVRIEKNPVFPYTHLEPVDKLFDAPPALCPICGQRFGESI